MNNRFKNLLTAMEKPGTFIVPREYDNLPALNIHIVALQHQGHAVVVDETVDTGERGMQGEVRVFHYITCKRCKIGAL